MIRHSSIALWVSLLLGITAVSNPSASRAQPLVPLDVGTVVAGFQDDFPGTTLNAAWIPVGATDIYSVSDGVLHVSTTGGDPNHLLYAGARYDGTTQEVLARIRVNQFGTGDPARGGIGVGVDPTSSQGINLHFRDGPLNGQSGPHVSLLDDFRAWGPAQAFPWKTNTWYWLRLRQEPDAPAQGAASDVFAKIWPADGLTPEPATWLTYDYIPSRSIRTGLAGITAGSSAGTSEFDVDYILIKAAGLPSITAAPGAFPLFHPGPILLTNQPPDLTTTACSTAEFRIGIDGTPPYRFQWYRNGAAIPGATQASLILPAVALSDDGTVFTVTASNITASQTNTVTSRNAILRVAPDPVPPALLGIVHDGDLTAVKLTFSKPIAVQGATNPGNFQIAGPNGPLAVTSARPGADPGDILLTTAIQSEGTTYSVIANHLTDACTGLSPVAADSKADFTARSYSSTDIGGATPPGSTLAVPGGYDLIGGGAGTLGISDQFQFGLRPRIGDFDVRVRVADLVGPDSWSEAGLMLRHSTTSGSRFAFVFATPGISGAAFRSRATDASAASQSGSYPVNFPNTWLRLKRAGNLVTGFASRDGQAWSLLGSATLSFSGQPYLGFAVASHNPAQTSKASFRDLSDVVNPTAEDNPPTLEAFGQSNRKTGLVISEIHYHPGTHAGFPGVTPGAATLPQLEFVELLNTTGIPEDISGCRIDGDVHFTFPDPTVIPGGACLVVARSPSDLQSAYSLTGVLGPYSGSLPNNSGRIQFRNPAGAILLEVNYDSAPPWPASADGAGHSLVLSHPSFGENDPRAWAASDRVGGSPGHLDTLDPEPLRSLVLNEFLAHSESGPADFVELYNHSNGPLDISGCVLTDDPGLDLYIVPGGTLLPPRGHVAFDQDKLGFALQASGGTLYLRNPSGNRVLDAVRYEAQSDGLTFGRCPDGSPAWRPLASPSPGSSNATRFLGDIVLNEIHHHPVSGLDDDQFVELFNRGTRTIDVGGWQFVAGIRFTFPTNTLIAPRAYLVVGRNAARLRAANPSLGPAAILGDFQGTLAHAGERLALARPELLTRPDPAGGQPSTNSILCVVAEVTYKDAGRWGQWSAGGGSSMELIHPDADPQLPANWADSDDTAKATWTVISGSGTADNGSITGDSLQVLLQSAGEALIDDVQVLNAQGVNLVANSTFEAGANGWVAEGTMNRSSLETTEGYNGGQSFHLRAVERGDNQVNRVRTRLSSKVTANTTVTIRAKVRWLKGSPSILFRIRGNWVEAAANLNLPSCSGTPGTRNSRALASAPPTLSDVVHSPVLPADRQDVRVTARVDFSHRPTAVRLIYRLDPATTYKTVAMTDDGTGGDTIPDDGTYTGTIPGQPTGTTAVFRVEAVDGLGVASQFPAAPLGECLVRFGELQPTGNLPVYRIWMTQANYNYWRSRNHLDNSPIDVTFVLGNQRVIYNAVALYAGSPYIAPGYCGPDCGRCGYSVSVPADDALLGSTDIVLDWPGGHGNESTAMQEQMAYWLAGRMGLPTCHRYPIRLHVNGVTDEQRGSIFEAVNQPASEFLKAWVPGDSNGDFYKVDRAFDFDDSGNLVADPMPTLQVFNTTGGVKKTARYRWNWNKRAVNNPNDYTNIFALVDALNAAGPEPYTSRTESLVDIEEWMGIFAAEHIIINFDSWGHDIPKNMYIYKPQNGKWQIYMFDLDWLMLASVNYKSDYTAKLAPLFVSSDPTVTRMYAHPPFRRAYYRAVKTAVDGPLLAANCEPLMDARYASYLANGVKVCDGQTLTPPNAVKTWFRDRRTALIAELKKVAAEFTLSGASQLTTTTSPITLKGTAPIQVKTLQLNGVDIPVTWTSVTNWSASIPLLHSTNEVALAGLGVDGQPLPGLTVTATVRYTGALPPSPAVLVNEWMASNTKTLADLSGPAPRYDDWFELYNAGSSPADLQGFYLTDSLANRSQFLIPAGYIIPPGGHLLVWADNQPEENLPGRPELHVNFQLSAQGEAIGLFAPDGTTVDSVTFGPQASDVSEGRCPDGSATILPIDPSSPGTANTCRPELPTPSLSWTQRAAETFALVAATQPGLRYQLETRDTLEGGPWTPFGTETVATGPSLSFDINTSTSSQHFYRLRVTR